MERQFKRHCAMARFPEGYFIRHSTEIERHGFGLPLCIDRSPRGTFGHVAAITTNQPLPFAADMQDGDHRSRAPRVPLETRRVRGV
jgi:hypothetical protein